MLYSQGPRAVNTSYLVGIGDVECFKVSHLSYTTWCPVGGREREGGRLWVKEGRVQMS